MAVVKIVVSGMEANDLRDDLQPRNGSSVVTGNMKGVVCTYGAWERGRLKAGTWGNRGHL